MYPSFPGGLWWDTPYGLQIAPWDQALTSAQMDRILVNFKTCTSSNQFSVCFFIHWKQIQLYLEAMNDAQLWDIHLNCWYKPNQTVCGLNTQVTNAIEHFIIGRYSNGKHADFNTPWKEDDPRKRQNHFEWPTNSVYAKHADGTKVNPTEKPPECIKWWLRRNVFPGDHIIICGGGAGGDVRGALEYGCSVTIIEQDPQQFKHLCNLVQTWDAEQAKAKTNLAILAAKEKAAKQPVLTLQPVSLVTI